MKPYILLEGSSHDIEEFETKIINALEAGYTLAGELISHPVAGQGSHPHIVFFQPLIWDEDDFDEEDFEEEGEEF